MCSFYTAVEPWKEKDVISVELKLRRGQSEEPFYDGTLVFDRLTKPFNAEKVDQLFLKFLKDLLNED